MVIFAPLLFALTLGAQWKALRSYKIGEEGLAKLLLVACAMLLIGSIILEFFSGLVPTRESPRIREFVSLTHVLLAGLECVVCITACLPLRPVVFRVAWWTSLTLVVAFFGVFLVYLNAPPI